MGLFGGRRSVGVAVKGFLGVHSVEGIGIVVAFEGRCMSGGATWVSGPVVGAATGEYPAAGAVVGAIVGRVVVVAGAIAGLLVRVVSGAIQR